MSILTGSITIDTLRYAVYNAPRGRKRLFALGAELGQRYISPMDRLIGIIGAEGSGKSTLIRGLFPGLELTNDDDGVNNRRTPLYSFSADDFFAQHTFHIDMRYEMAFHQMWEIVEAVNKVIHSNRRVVIEHFDLIYKRLGFNAQIIFAIGEEVRVFRPSIFGPSPLEIKKTVDANLRYRLMAHSAEDIVGHILQTEYGYKPATLHSDIRHGFIIGFPTKPDFSIPELEAKVRDVVERDVKIAPDEGDYIKVGEERIYCTGKRIHVKRSGQIEFFRLLKEFRFDPMAKQYLLVGIVGREEIDGFDELPPPEETDEGEGGERA